MLLKYAGPSVSAFRRHMHPTYNGDRRQARVRFLEELYWNNYGTRYTDAATYSHRRAHAIVAFNSKAPS